MTTKSTKKAPRKTAAKKSTAKKAKPKRAPKTKATPPATAAAKGSPAKEATPRPRDPRLPKPGAILRREHQGKVIEIEVLDRGFKFDGRTWRSLSAIAREVTGVVWNGFLWAGLQRRAAKKAPAAPKGGAE
jgi:Protein of unknown function (DUF2924)